MYIFTLNKIQCIIYIYNIFPLNIKFSKNKSIVKTRPRAVVKLSEHIYNHIKGWRKNGLIKLAYTEKKANIKIIYLKKKKVLIISSDNTSAINRILDKLKNYKKNFREHKRNMCKLCE